MLVTPTQPWFDLGTTPNKTIFALWPDKRALAIHRIARAVKTRSFKKQGENAKTKENETLGFSFSTIQVVCLSTTKSSSNSNTGGVQIKGICHFAAQEQHGKQDEESCYSGWLESAWETRAASLAWSGITPLTGACTTPGTKTWLLSHAPSGRWAPRPSYPVPWSSRAPGTDVPFSFTRWTSFLFLHIQTNISPQLNGLQHTRWPILAYPQNHHHQEYKV